MRSASAPRGGEVLQQAAAGQQRHLLRGRELARAMLEAEIAHLRGRRADEGDAGRFAASRRTRRSRSGSRSRDGSPARRWRGPLRGCAPRSGSCRRARRRRRARPRPPAARAVRGGPRRSRPRPTSMPRRRAVRMMRQAMAPRLAMRILLNTSRPTTITRTGVGLKPLQGLLSCGQFEMSTSTSISARICDVAAGGGDAVRTMQRRPVGVHRHVHEEVDVGDHVALAAPVTAVGAAGSSRRRRAVLLRVMAVAQGVALARTRPADACRDRRRWWPVMRQPSGAPSLERSTVPVRQEDVALGARWCPGRE